jgi:hypothetical protein
MQAEPERMLPFLTMENKIIGTRDLQKISSKSLSILAKTGPQIIAISGVKQAVLVDYKQYIHFQESFNDILKKMLVINQILPKVPDGHKLHIDELRLEISGTLKRIATESPDTSPFVDLMDAVLGIATGLFSGETHASPPEMRSRTRSILSSTARKVHKKHGRPKRNITE